MSTVLNQSLDLRRATALTGRVTTARTVRADRASSTQEAILKAAERLYAEHGVFAVSNRQVSEAAGQGNNAAVGYHFGTKTDLVRAIEQKHRASIERLLERMVADTGDSADLRDWVACLVCSLTEYHKIVIKDALASRSLVAVVDGITRCLPDLPMPVVTERNIMARNLMMHTCADFERAFAEGADVPRTTWTAVGSGLIDAIVGLWCAPVTEHP